MRPKTRGNSTPYWTRPLATDEKQSSEIEEVFFSVFSFFFAVFQPTHWRKKERKKERERERESR